MKIKIYHGTTASKAKSIIGDGNFVFQQRPDHWLGQGVYFFVNDYDAAVWWAGQGQDKDVKRAVLEYELEVDENDLLDLDTLTGMRKFNEFLEEAERLITVSDVSTVLPDSKVVSRAKSLQIYYEFNDIKYCISTFEIPDRVEFRNVLDLGFVVKERQIVVIKYGILNVSKIKIHFI